MLDVFGSCCPPVRYWFDRFPLGVGCLLLLLTISPLLPFHLPAFLSRHFRRFGEFTAGGEDVDGVVVSLHHEDGVSERVQSIAATDGRLRPGGRRTRLGDVLAPFTGETRTISQVGHIIYRQIIDR